MVQVFKRKGRARWYYKVRSLDGRWQQRAGFTDKRATERKAAEEQAAIDRGAVGLVDPFAAHRRQAIGEHVDAFVAALEGRNRSLKYVTMTHTRLRRVLQVMQAQTLDTLNFGAAEAALGAMLKGTVGKAIAPKTRDHYASTLREFGTWLVDSGRVAANPLARLSRVATDADVRVSRQALTFEAVHRLVEAAEERPVFAWRRSHPNASTDELNALRQQGRRRGLLYLFAALTGLRRAEIAGLRWADLRLGDSPAVTPRPGTTKAKRRDPLPLDARLAELLNKHRSELARDLGRLPGPSDAVFHVPKNLTEQIMKDAEFAGIPVVDAEGRRLDLHALRATYATMMATAGVPQQITQKLMRHTDARLGAKHYERMKIEELRDGGTAKLSSKFWSADMAPQVAPNVVPLPAAVGCSVPLAQLGTAIAEQVEVASERHATPLEGVSCRSVPVAEELWRRRESNPRPTQATAGLQRDGTTGGTKTAQESSSDDHGRHADELEVAGPAQAVDRLRTAVRELQQAGPPPLPPDLRQQLAALIAPRNDATRSPRAWKQVGDRAAFGCSRNASGRTTAPRSTHEAGQRRSAGGPGGRRGR